MGTVLMREVSRGILASEKLVGGFVCTVLSMPTTRAGISSKDN